MRRMKLTKGFLMVSILTLLTACGGPGDEVSVFVPGGGSTLALSGQVADGYLVGARVFLDRNGNRILDSGEPWTRSGERGRFSLDVAEGDAESYPVVAEIIAGETIDEDRPGQYVSENYQLTAPAGKGEFVSPLTTLVQAELEKNPALNIAAAESKIREQVGLAADMSLFTDYVADNRLDYAHRAGRLVAGLMGRVMADVELNVGIDDFETQKAAIALMISDLVMCHCDKIAMALDSAENSEAIEQILSDLLAGIDTAGLDEELLARYLERMEQDRPIWDMTAPEVSAQVPPVHSSASIDTLVKLSFDEPIDPATITSDAIVISGPNGTVPGLLSYDATLNELSFEPDSFLLAFSNYSVYLNQVEDLHGNPVKQTEDWSFTTIFDQLPPELPEF